MKEADQTIDTKVAGWSCLMSPSGEDRQFVPHAYILFPLFHCKWRRGQGEEVPRTTSECSLPQVCRQPFPLAPPENACYSWRMTEPMSQAKGAPEKVAIACRLRQATTITLKWIATELRWGTHVSNLLSQRRQASCRGGKSVNS